MIRTVFELNLNNHKDFPDEANWFQQDGSPVHNERQQDEVVREMLPIRFISLRGCDQE